MLTKVQARGKGVLKSLVLKTMLGLGVEPPAAGVQRGSGVDPLTLRRFNRFFPKNKLTYF